MAERDVFREMEEELDRRIVNLYNEEEKCTVRYIWEGPMREILERLRGVLKREGLTEFMRKADWEYSLLKAEEDEDLRHILQVFCVRLFGEAVFVYSQFREKAMERAKNQGGR